MPTDLRKINATTEANVMRPSDSRFFREMEEQTYT